jgi:hypothetical protein
MFAVLWRSRLRYYRKHNGPLYVRMVRLMLGAGLTYQANRTRKDAALGRLSGEARTQHEDMYRRAREMLRDG